MLLSARFSRIDGTMKLQHSTQESPLSANFDALAPSGAAKFPSLQRSRATRASCPQSVPGVRALGTSSRFGPIRRGLRIAPTSLAGRFATWSGTLGISWAAVVSCAEPPPKEALSLGQDSQEFVNGGDDRLEYFELTE